jgi:hypothetical protein
MEAEYGQLFSDPSGDLPVDRALMSLVAIASLRSQEGGAFLSWIHESRAEPAGQSDLKS